MKEASWWNLIWWREQRFCNNCSEKVIGDEMHFFLGCPKFLSERGRLFYDLDQLYGLRNNGDFLTFNLLMNYGFGDTHMAGKILKYVNECFNTWECKSWSEVYLCNNHWLLYYCMLHVVMFVVYVVCSSKSGCGYSFIVCFPQCTSCTRDNKGIWIWIWWNSIQSLANH